MTAFNIIWADEEPADGPFPLGEPEPIGTETIVEPEPEPTYEIEPSGVIDPFDFPAEQAPLPAEIETHHGRRVPWGANIIHGLAGDKYRKSYAEETTIAASCRQALQETGLNFNVDFADIVTEDVVTDIGVGPLEIPPRYAVYGSHGKVLGITSERYGIYQPHQLATWTDLLLEETILSAVGMTNGGGYGARMYTVVEIPQEFYPPGMPDENVMLHLLTTNSFDGSTSLRVSIVPTREVCVNTMRMTIADLTLAWSIRHTKDMERNMVKAREAIQTACEWGHTMTIDAQELLAINVSKDTGRTIIEELLPIPEPEIVGGKTLNERAILNAQRRQDDAFSMWVNSPNLENVRATGWGLVQGLGEWDQHGRAGRRSHPMDRLVNGVQHGKGGDSLLNGVRERVLALG